MACNQLTLNPVNLLFFIGFLEIGIIDMIDVLLVAFLIFQLYKLIRGSVAGRVFIGLILFYLVYLVVKAARMELLTAILGQFIGVGVIAALILFQQEIRKFLLMLAKSSVFGNNGLLSSLFGKNDNINPELDLDPVLEAAKSMSGTNTGGLIVFAKTADLSFYADSGDLIEGQISKRLLLAIFNKTSPLHDGAVLITEGRIKAARCILPVTEDPDLPAHFGLRHRAALGLTESTDAVVLVISEETGQLALAYNGAIETNLSVGEAKNHIINYLYELPETAAALKHEEHTTQSIPAEVAV